MLSRYHNFLLHSFLIKGSLLLKGRCRSKARRSAVAEPLRVLRTLCNPKIESRQFQYVRNLFFLYTSITWWDKVCLLLILK
ncbi:hypothetical protein VIGAN_04000300 [Vigna angularis var. angularis]|uniref:Uncharacterized protein n=1 Tax=Vigna angularis var. angularis TaxID=157739 RepID=A0A0S3RQN5_PHAAN|nr:hypothetical protein VIGAN_04000300 [Vigna angularis var. angularis]